ncbi:MAG: metal-dependent hydrolase [Thermoanaerobaculia bacterium]|nr:metal-dependent hydrolase [Thermoanaerobaculia bacterium]
MDPLTHTLVGTSLAATRLGTTTRYATVALVVGANLPDVDVLSYAGGGDAALGFRRGWTHGLLALTVLPALLAAALVLWGRWRAGSSTAPRPSTGWLVALSYLAVSTHPALDWLNTYGMRWGMPFDGTWYYGDSVFIVDPWLWLLLGGGWLLGRRPNLWLTAAWALVALPLLFLLVRSSPQHALPVGVVLALLLLALWWKIESARARRLAAGWGLATAAAFVLAMLTVHALTEDAVRRRLDSEAAEPIDELMVGPIPADPLRWEFVVERAGRLRHGTLSWLEGGQLRYSGFDRPVARAHPRWEEIRRRPEIAGFLDWGRFPWIAASTPSAGSRTDRFVVLDARYQRVATVGFGAVVIEIDASP